MVQNEKVSTGGIQIVSNMEFWSSSNQSPKQTEL